MKRLTNEQKMGLCLKLLHSDSEKEQEFITTLYKSATALVTLRIYQKLDGKISKLTKENKPDYENMSVQERVSDGVVMVLLPIITKLGAEAKKQTFRTLEE